jgi:hypothetical protein
MVNRRLLNWGVFLLAAGGVMLAATAGILDPGLVAQALALWPLLFIAWGLRLLLRRTRIATPTGALAAALPGLLLGGLVVAVPTVTPSCRIGQPPTYAQHDGTFDGSASAEISLSCGDLDIATTNGTGWRVEAGETGGTAPILESDGHRLRLATANQHLPVTWSSNTAGWSGDAFRVTLPTANPIDLQADVNAGRARLNLADARLGRVNLDINASSLDLDLSSATLDRLVMDVNASSATIRLPRAADFNGDISVNAARVSICVPPELGLRVQATTVLGSTHLNGMVRANGTGRSTVWETPNYASAGYTAAMNIETNVGSVDINPVGGCK